MVVVGNGEVGRTSLRSVVMEGTSISIQCTWRGGFIKLSPCIVISSRPWEVALALALVLAEFMFWGPSAKSAASEPPENTLHARLSSPHARCKTVACGWAARNSLVQKSRWRARRRTTWLKARVRPDGLVDASEGGSERFARVVAAMGSLRSRDEGG